MHVESFLECWSLYAASLYRFCCRAVRSREDADEIYAEILYHALSGWDTLKDMSAAKAWFFGIARNRLKMYYRRNKNEYPLPTHELDVLCSSQSSDSDAVTRLDLHAFCKSLPEEWARILLLHVEFEMPLREIAAMLGLSYFRVQRRIHRIKEALRESMKEV